MQAGFISKVSEESRKMKVMKPIKWHTADTTRKEMNSATQARRDGISIGI
jgi:hypothetical protein